MASVFPQHVCVKGGNLQSNKNCNSPYKEVNMEGIVRLRTPRECIGIVSPILPIPLVTLKNLKKNSLPRHRKTSARLGVYRRSVAQQDTGYKRGHFVGENFGHSTQELPVSKSSPGRASTVCRVHSVEGTEQSYNSSETDLEQEKLESFTELLEGSGEIREAPKQEVGGHAEEVDSLLLAEKTNREPNGKPHHESSLVHSDTATGMAEKTKREHNGEADDEPNEVYSDVAAGTASPAEIQDYGAGTDWEDDLEYVTRIPVSRQRYIPASKVDVVNALLLLFFPANKDASKFLSVCSYLEMLLHAESKVLLEELRSDYGLTHCVQDGSKLLTARGATNSKKLGTASNERDEKHESIGKQEDWPTNSTEMDDGAELNPLKALTDLRARFMTAFNPKDGSDDRVADGVEDWPTNSTEMDDGAKQEPLKALTDLGARFMTAVKPNDGSDDGVADSVEEISQGPTCDVEASEAAAERFQKNIVRILRRAEFEGISVRDMELTDALNSDYLLSTPVDVDWKRTSLSNVKIFRRGYTKEEQKGLLLGEKLDYLQSFLLRQFFKGFTGPLFHAGRWCIRAWNSLWDDRGGRELAKSVSGWLQEPLQLENQEPLKDAEAKSDNAAHLDMPIWLAARQAIPRYEAILNSAGARGLLIRRILVRMGLLQSETASQTLPTEDETFLEPHLRSNHLSRVSMKDIWQPASTAVAGRNPWKRISAAFSVFFSQATLQEPAFKDLVLFYDPDVDGDSEAPVLQLQTYKGIPIPDLKMIFPNKRFLFRLLDTLRLDITSITGLLAFTINYHFDNFFSSPSAFVLDVIASSALVVFVTRVGFGYKQVWDRYQLLVNKTLYEKTGARGFGVVQFLLDESEEQQFKEAVLVYTILMHRGKAEAMTTKQLADTCERILYYRCKEQVDMPIDNAVSTLLKVGLIVPNEDMSAVNSVEVGYRALSYEEGLKALEEHWASIPSTVSLWN